ncbi:MAG TPA: polysaccharide deacetylase family protein [Xanthomonadaceae bacterium]|nr:polysaccharide deacetylase family protein [Xanthomonadaceae bacterium]
MGKLILTYHCARLESSARSGNDLLAVQEDLAWLAAHGVAVHPLHALLSPECGDGVALTFDDGTRIDGEPLEHPTLGPLPSLLQILSGFRRRLPGLHASAFVIASPQARQALSSALADQFGPDLMHERWWRPTSESGLIALENHSWDHNHPLVAHTAQRSNHRGTFANIDTEAEAEAEVTQASDYIQAACGRRPRYLAYPWGEASDFLRNHWLPRRGPQIGLEAAFGTEPAPLTAAASRWNLPRYVCGRDWDSTDALAHLLAACAVTLDHEIRGSPQA